MRGARSGAAPGAARALRPAAQALIAAACAALLGLGAADVRGSPSIEVEPARVLEGEPVAVRLLGLTAGTTVTLRVSRQEPRFPTGIDVFRGQATFVVPADGVVDLGRDAPRDGSSYAGVDPQGPFWSMRAMPEPGIDTSPMSDGEVGLELEVAGQVEARARVILGLAAADVVVRDVRENGVVAVAAWRPGARGAGVVLLGGSEGGLHAARSLAPLLASHGYTVLGVGYFSGGEPDLPLPQKLERIPVETVDAAVRWLERHGSVEPGRIAIVGVSKGAELALLAASHRPHIRAVAAFAPSHVVWEGIGSDPKLPADTSWTLDGQPLPFVRWSFSAHRRVDATRRATGSSRLVDAHLESLAEHAGDVAAAAILVERSHAAFFLAAGIDDGMWPSAYAAERLAARLRAAGHARTVQLELVDTGHQVLGTGWAPTTAFNRGSGRLQGGSPGLDARAQAMLWRKLLAFLHSELR